MTQKFTLFETKAGWMGIAGVSAGIRKVILPVPNRESALKAITDSDKIKMEYSEEAFLEAKTALTEYFDGKRTDLDISLDLNGSFRTAFVLFAVPSGAVESPQRGDHDRQHNLWRYACSGITLHTVRDAG